MAIHKPGDNCILFLTLITQHESGGTEPSLTPSLKLKTSLSVCPVSEGYMRGRISFEIKAVSEIKDFLLHTSGA